MLKLLIVEDEQFTRERLADLIDWQSIGIEVIGLATNGLDALRRLTEEPVDLVLTDIRMPQMDGLQLVQEIRNRDWPMKCILLSGYGDFEYAQKAMRLGVTDYLVKPCSPEEIRKLFHNVVSSILEERQRTDQIKGLEHQLHLNAPRAKMELLRQWLHHPPFVTERRQAQMGQFHIAISYEHPILFVFRFPNRTLDRSEYKPKDLQLIAFAASNIIGETMEQALMQPVEVVRDQDYLVVIGNGSFQWMDEKIAAALAKVRQNIEQFLRLEISVGVSDPKPNLESLHESYQEALQALEYRFFYSTDIVYYKDIAKHKETLPSNVNLIELLRIEQAAIEHLKAGLYAELLNDTEQWLDIFHHEYSQSRIHINTRTLAFLSNINQAALSIRQSSWTISDLHQMTQQILQVETIEELSGFVYRTIRDIVERLNPQKTPKRKVQQALDYIAEHYATSGLSLAGVAKALFVSSTYLSSLFKQELGVNFLDYVHQFRIEKAKSLMQTSDLKIQTVAREVGYFDEAHFTKTFKKWTGMLPSQYKREVQK